MALQAWGDELPFLARLRLGDLLPRLNDTAPLQVLVSVPNESARVGSARQSPERATDFLAQEDWRVHGLISVFRKLRRHLRRAFPRRGLPPLLPRRPFLRLSVDLTFQFFQLAEVPLLPLEVFHLLLPPLQLQMPISARSLAPSQPLTWLELRPRKRNHIVDVTVLVLRLWRGAAVGPTIVLQLHYHLVQVIGSLASLRVEHLPRGQLLLQEGLLIQLLLLPADCSCDGVLMEGPVGIEAGAGTVNDNGCFRGHFAGPPRGTELVSPNTIRRTPVAVRFVVMLYDVVAQVGADFTHVHGIHCGSGMAPCSVPAAFVLPRNVAA